MDHVDQLCVDLYYAIDALLQRLCVSDTPLVRALGGPSGQSGRESRPECGGRSPCGLPRLGDVKPLLLPHLDGVDKVSVWPQDPCQFTNHGPSTVHMLTANHLGLDVEHLQP